MMSYQRRMQEALKEQRALVAKRDETIAGLSSALNAVNDAVFGHINTSISEELYFFIRNTCVNALREAGQFR